jgi:hypothetical protein
MTDIHIHNIRLNGQCSIFEDCERVGNEIFAVRLTAATDYVAVGLWAAGLA